MMIKRFDDDYYDESYDGDVNIDNEFDDNCPNWLIGKNHLVIMIMMMIMRMMVMKTLMVKLMPIAQNG